MQIALDLIQRTLIVKLGGELDHHSTDQIRNLIERAITERDVRHLIFDFSDLSFMDSSGIGMIIGRYKLIKSLGGNVLLVVTNARIQQLVTMSGLHRLIPIFQSAEEALKKIEEATKNGK